MIKLSFVGDISLGEHYFSFGHGPRSLIESGTNIFDSISPLLAKSDLVFGNLEGPISDIGYEKTSPHKRVFRGSPDALAQLKNAGFNVIGVANNHIVQHGEAAAEESVALLESAGLTVVGLRRRPINYLKINDTVISIVSCSLIPDNTDKNQHFYFSPTADELIATITAASTNSAFTIVYIHWGDEGKLGASEAQNAFANDMMAAGANIVIGHHTHTLQPIRYENNRLVAFSLGNFVFDLPWSFTNRESVVLELDINNHSIQNAGIHRVHIDNQGKPYATGQFVALTQGEHAISQATTVTTPNEPFKKLYFFLSNLLKGDTGVKLRFLSWKMFQKLK